MSPAKWRPFYTGRDELSNIRRVVSLRLCYHSVAICQSALFQYRIYILCTIELINTKVFIQENAFESVVCEMAAILLGGR